jgi:hypothetical protein
MSFVLSVDDSAPVDSNGQSSEIMATPAENSGALKVDMAELY